MSKKLAIYLGSLRPSGRVASQKISAAKKLGLRLEVESELRDLYRAWRQGDSTHVIWQLWEESPYLWKEMDAICMDGDPGMMHHVVSWLHDDEMGPEIPCYYWWQGTWKKF